jgi:hypothetical protein
MATNPAEIKIHLFRETDKLPEQYLVDLQKLIYNYLSNIKTREVRNAFPELTT